MPEGWQHQDLLYYLPLSPLRAIPTAERLEYGGLSHESGRQVDGPLTIFREEGGPMQANGPQPVMDGALADNMLGAFNLMQGGDGAPASMLTTHWAGAVWTWCVYGTRFYDGDPRWSRMPERPDPSPVLGPWGEPGGRPRGPSERPAAVQRV